MFLQKDKIQTILLFSINLNILDEWEKKINKQPHVICIDIDFLKEEIQNTKSFILLADYDSVAHDINNFISSGTLAERTIILERVPEITTGKMLISQGVKAYGNSRMIPQNFTQMLKAVMDHKIWTYPELTSALIKNTKEISLNNDAKKMIKKRLTKKELEVIKFLLKGLTNDAIALKLSISTRTVKAHVSSIFKRLHVNDRISLVLLLK